jgi:hypothetical protein
MSKYQWIVALLAIGIGATSESLGHAKPPDLPANGDVRCPEDCREADTGQPLGAQIETGAARAEETGPLSIDAWCPNLMPLLTQCFCQRIVTIMQPVAAAPDRNAAADDAVRAGLDPAFAATALQARHLYEAALRCLRAGKLAEARAHLREAHLANPTCRFGRLAIERLQELEALPPGEEPQSDEAESTEAERVFRRVRQTTQPLGLVQPETY